MKSTAIAVLIVFTYGCGNNNEVKPVEKDKSTTYAEAVSNYLATNPASAPSVLKFTFGISKKLARRHIDSLIKAKKIEQRASVTFSTINWKVEGWPYTLYLTPDKPVSTIFDIFYQGDSLYMVSMLPYGDFEEKELLQFLHTQYGEPSFSIQDTSSKYSNEMINYWFKNDYQISYSAQALIPVKFSNIRLEQKAREGQRVLDSLVTEVKKDASDETKKDFQ